MALSLSKLHVTTVDTCRTVIVNGGFGSMLNEVIVVYLKILT